MIRMSFPARLATMAALYDPSTEHVFVLLLIDDSRSPEQLGNDLLEIVRTT